jgi:two-component system chemotaxis response regulator CheB
MTLASAAKIYKEDLICVILTGMGHDGTNGAGVVKKFGGYCIAEDESTAVIYGMPKCVVDAGHADEVVPLHKIANAIVQAVYR